MAEEHKLTPAMGRVLQFLDRSGRWHLLLEIDRIRLLDEDDVLTVPALIEDGLVLSREVGAQGSKPTVMVAISSVGRAALARHRGETP